MMANTLNLQILQNSSWAQSTSEWIEYWIDDNYFKISVTCYWRVKSSPSLAGYCRSQFCTFESYHMNYSSLSHVDNYLGNQCPEERSRGAIKASVNKNSKKMWSKCKHFIWTKEKSNQSQHHLGWSRSQSLLKDKSTILTEPKSTGNVPVQLGKSWSWV